MKALNTILGLGLFVASLVAFGLGVASWFTDVDAPSTGLLWIVVSLVFLTRAELRLP
jgi:dipeptide/tripeptide permease